MNRRAEILEATGGVRRDIVETEPEPLTEHVSTVQVLEVVTDLDTLDPAGMITGEEILTTAWAEALGAALDALHAWRIGWARGVLSPADDREVLWLDEDYSITALLMYTEDVNNYLAASAGRQTFARTCTGGCGLSVSVCAKPDACDVEDGGARWKRRVLENGRTSCCGAATTYHDWILCCKACWEEVEDEDGPAAVVEMPKAKR